jgi:hypothetical protein
VSAAEWDDVYHILVQVKKQQQYQNWRDQETQLQISLAPGLFRLSEAVPILLPWRATWQTRLGWEDTLQARISQLQATKDGGRAAVSAVEEQTLPL